MIGHQENQSQVDLINIYRDFNKEYGHIEGVFEVLEQFLCLWEKEYWESLFKVHRDWAKNLQALSLYIDKQTQVIPHSLVLMQAIKNGICPGQHSMGHSVNFHCFRDLNIFLEKIHSLYIGGALVEDDLWALHKSDLAERVLGVLDQFDVFKGNIFLKDDFFNCLKKVSWNSEAKSFFIKIHNLFTSFLFEKQGNHENSFNQELKNVLVLLAHCSAVWSDSTEIHTQHVIRAYKTLFKIITTDITLLVDKSYYTGRLLCEKCKQSYELLEDEAPYDFSQCSCGGDLYYVNSPKSSNKNIND
ncbi:MAG: hypothetical protein HVN35_05550 [Methanobacteriaceae archaeon]|nr:hypothetical protein [Methanobacteriaceae archaeon]